METSLTHFTPGSIWPDDNGVHINAHGGGMLLVGETYYWFGEHKIEGEAGNVAMVGVHAYSSTDLYNWKDEGIALKVSDDTASDIVRGCAIERPKVIYNALTKKYVMWFHLEFITAIIGYHTARSGVAIADNPAGPYEFVTSLRPDAGVWPDNVPNFMKKPLSPEELSYVKSIKMPGGLVPDYPHDLIFRRDFSGGQMARDMSLFVDDDGSAYHLYSSEENGTLHISQLSPDYLKSGGRYVRIFSGRFHEAPAMMKRKGVYYLFSSDCTGWAPNPGRVSTAPSIWGPWTELGNPCVGHSSQLADTFESQPTYLLPVAGREDAYIYMGDRWRPKNAIDGRYIWLPIEFSANNVPFVQWRDEWNLDIFD